MFGHDDRNDNKDEAAAESAVDSAAAAAASDPAATSSPDPGFIAAPAPGSDDTTTVAPSRDLPPATGSSDLLSIKQQALQQLSPLVSHLNQTPEEKFRTTMMMIQATDDQTLITAAYDAAKGITDDKTRAQALLDIINEINYFTQQQAA